MNIAKLSLNGQSFADDVARTTGIVVEEVSKAANLATYTFQRQTGPGAIVGRSIAEARLFIVKGKVFGGTKALLQAAINRLDAAVRPDDLLNSPLLPMQWEDRAGNGFKASVQVTKMPEYSGEVGDLFLDFEFQVLSPSATYSGSVDHSSAGAVGEFGGNTLPNLLPNVLADVTTGALTITNAGNYPAPFKVTVSGAILEPKVFNATNGRFYGLTGRATSSLVLDGTASPFTAKDGDTDVSGWREPGSTTPLLSVGANTLIVLGKSWTFGPTPPTVTIQWNDAYIQS